MATARTADIDEFAAMIAAKAHAAACAARDRLTEMVGGLARRRVVLVLAGVLTLSSADRGAIGALARQLEASCHVGNTRIGLLVTVSSLLGAVASLPMGILADRVNRVRLLVATIALWSAAMVVRACRSASLC